MLLTIEKFLIKMHKMPNVTNFLNFSQKKGQKIVYLYYITISFVIGFFIYLKS